MTEEKKDRSIFSVILLPILSVLVIEMLLLVGCLLLGGITTQLNQNAKDILSQQVENRGNYLVNEMNGNWSGLDMLSEKINGRLQERLDTREISLLELNQNSDGCVDFLKEICPELIETMYTKQVSGIFIVLNTYDTKDGEAPETRPGIYLRDLDPTSTPSDRNADILIERAPTEVVQSGHIAMDTGWQPVFSKEDNVGQPYFYQPFQTAYSDGGKLKAKEYGYWTTEPYHLSGDSRTAIAYSVPLILEDGTVYGVLGVELLTEYVQSLLPYGELMENKNGSYLLAFAKEGETQLKPVVLSGERMKAEDALLTLKEGTDREAESSDGKHYAAAKPLIIYNRNAPFDSDKWYLLGAASDENLFAFSRQVQTTLFLSLAATMLIGLCGILYASYKLSKPIHLLSKEVERAQESGSLPVLPDTGIREIDQFADAITRLEHEVVDSSTRFLRIMDMASVELAGYEFREDSDSVFVTENYFPLLGIEGVDIKSLTAEEFRKKQDNLRKTLSHTVSEDGSIVYGVPLSEGGVRYLRSEYTKDAERCVGLIEDVTAATLEKMRIERERDCDGLTKLYGRRGFRREADELFLNPERLKNAGLLMIDLDNLKKTNDKFGHNFGDLYIQTAGKCFLQNTPEGTLCARISGDEFLILFYGYDSRDEIREKLRYLYNAIKEVKFILPDGSNMGLSASGGVAWYPEDTRDLSELMKYADFAMYQIKRSTKGEMGEFDKDAYKQQTEQNQSRLEFHQMLENKQVDYHFQPIFDAKTGETYAYEALMRVNLPMIHSPETVLRLAKEEDRMRDVEAITMFRSTECYKKLLEKGAVSDKAFLFINSIANVCMTEEEDRKYHEQYSDLQPRIVLEITEVEHLDMQLVERKRNVEGFTGTFALDDYGSGYNSEVSLLDLKPKYVKVDITIVRDMDKDLNKQQIISNIVDYAHKRDMLVIAEGLETEAETLKALELGVDLLQGYFLARPAAIPSKISEEASRVIRSR